MLFGSWKVVGEMVAVLLSMLTPLSKIPMVPYHLHSTKLNKKQLSFADPCRSFVRYQTFILNSGIPCVGLAWDEYLHGQDTFRPLARQLATAPAASRSVYGANLFAGDISASCALIHEIDWLGFAETSKKHHLYGRVMDSMCFLLNVCSDQFQEPTPVIEDRVMPHIADMLNDAPALASKESCWQAVNLTRSSWHKHA